MNCITELPVGYRQVLEIDLQKNKKLAWLVNGLSAGLVAGMLVLGCFMQPISIEDFLPPKGFVTILGLFLYIILHELTHGICMKYYGSKTVKYGFTSLYVYAGASDYFSRKAHRVISLAPIVFWGIVLVLLNVFLDASRFWVVYWIQVCNISGACGDLYITYRLAKLPEDILVRDSGVAMTVYSRG